MNTALHFLLWPVALAGVTALAQLPAWSHALDNHAVVQVNAEQPLPPLPTRNVDLAGVPEIDAAVIKTKTTRMNWQTIARDEKVMVPIVGEAWKKGDPVHFVLVAQKSALEQSNSLVRAGEGVREVSAWKGSVRNAPMEDGFSSKESELFASAGAPLAADAVRVEVLASDYLWSYGLSGAAFFVGLFIAEGIRQKRAKQAVETVNHQREAA